MSTRGLRALRNWIRIEGHNQSDVAKILGVHRGHVSRILAGERNVNLGVAIILFRVAGIPIEAWESRRSRS